MRTLLIDMADFGGEASPNDRVRLSAPVVRGSAEHAGRLVTPAGRTVRLVDGRCEVPEVEPGPLRVQLQPGGGTSQPFDVSVPDGDGVVTLRNLLESQFTYEPPIVSAVQRSADRAEEAERGSVSAEGRSVAAAERAEEKVEAALTNAAGMVRDEVKDDADRAESKAGVATEQAGLARGHREGAEDAETSAHGAAGAAAAETTALIRDEMDDRVGEAAQSAHLAGLSAEASESSSVTAGNHSQSAAGSDASAAQHAQAAGGHAGATAQDRSAVAEDRSAVESIVSDQIVPIGEQVAQDRTAVAADRSATEQARDTAEQHRDDAREAAENAQTGAPVGGWVREDLSEPVRESLSRADTAMQSLPSATENARGGIRLAGDLAGDAEAPTVPGLSGKSDVGHEHTMSEISDLPEVTPGPVGGAIVQRHPDGGIQIPEPSFGSDPATVNYVANQVETRTTPQQVADQITAARLPGRWFSGDGPPPAADIGAIPGDFWLDESTMDVHKFEEEQ